MSRGSMPPLEDDFARALLGSAEADAPSHAAYVKAATALGLGVGLGVGASLPAAPAAVAVGAAGIASVGRWSSTLGAKLALLGVSGALLAGAGALLARSSEPAKSEATQSGQAPRLPAAPAVIERALPAPATASSDRAGSQLAASVARPLGSSAGAKSAATSEQASPSAARPFAAAPPPSARRVGHALSPHVSSGSSLAEQVQSLDRARVALGGGDSASALREIARYRAAWPNGVFVTEASVLEIEALAAQGARALAATRAAAFVAAHPDSPQADRLRALAR